jgi:hypothetical protein
MRTITAILAFGLLVGCAAAPKPEVEYLSVVTVSAPDGTLAIAYPIATDKTIKDCSKRIPEFVLDPEHAPSSKIYLEAGGTIRGYCFAVQGPVFTLKPEDLRVTKPPAKAAPPDQGV